MITTGVPTHQQFEIQQLAFSVQETAILLGLCQEEDNEQKRRSARKIVLRLIRNGKLRARQTGRFYIISGSAIQEYLDGADKPIRHPDSL